MDNLVDAFCDAVEAWARETGAEGRNAVIWVMGWGEGDRHVEALGKTDATGMSEEEIGERSNLASQLGKAGRLDEALAAFESLLEDRLRLLGADHPDTLKTRNYLDSIR